MTVLPNGPIARGPYLLCRFFVSTFAVIFFHSFRTKSFQNPVCFDQNIERSLSIQRTIWFVSTTKMNPKTDWNSATAEERPTLLDCFSVL